VSAVAEVDALGILVLVDNAADSLVSGMWLMAYSLWGRVSSTRALRAARIRRSSAVLTSAVFWFALPQGRLIHRVLSPGLAGCQHHEQSGHRHRHATPNPVIPDHADLLECLRRS
jgi:hypothetical protein